MPAATETLWEMIGQSTASPICAFDKNCRLIGFNQAHSDEFFRIYNYRVQLGDVFPDLFLPEQGPVIRAFMERALAGELFTVVVEFGDPDLFRPYWEISYAPLRGEDGEIIGAFHLAQDISARLRAEAELGAAQHALRQAQKMEAVGQLTGGIAHDFNNLLMAVGGNLELLSIKMSADHPMRKYVDRANLAVDRGAKLTSQLLAFSRTQKLDIRPTLLDPALKAAASLLRNALGAVVDVELDLDTEGCWAATAADQLDLAMLNLATNARDAMPEGGTLKIRSQLRRTRLPSGGPVADYLSIEVSDVGVGMTEKVASQAIEPFFTTKAPGKGTGLGLAQVYGFVRQCGGDLKITSVVGRGTTIELLLPRAEPDWTSPKQAVSARREPQAPIAGIGRTILVVDDDDAVRSVLTEALLAVGFTVVEADSGEEALRRLDDVMPAAAIIDFIMPGMNGAEVARRAQDKYPLLPIIFVSGYFDTIALDSVSGATVLRKPLDIAGLHSAVSNALI